MDTDKVDQLLKFALAIAGRRDTPREREVGPIHFIKLVYLADLAYAQRHRGQTFTGAPWRFYHYGPWAVEVWKRIEPVVAALDASERTFSSQYNDDVKRWSLQDSEQAEELAAELDRVLPVEVTSAITQGIRQFSADFGVDTTSLLHEVYRTQPMLGTRPGQLLRFDLAVLSDLPQSVDETSAPVQLSAKKQKKRKEAALELRAQVQQKLREQKKRRLVPPPTPPAYDEEFIQGAQWLDSLAGDPITDEKGELHFSDEVWTAPGRGDPSGN
ncbi:hypothetical protein [Corallococcus sp. 4LFB]|uniref:hypothetical protein n=1 Tax=Corallococcus sp. 4LFB TaxID=3383249 RepID=UPI0039770836